MLRTYLYIPEELSRKAAFMAKQQKKSKAAVMREAMERGINRVPQSGGADVLLKIAQLGKKYNVKGPKDGVEHFDNYLYGQDWSKSG